MHIAIDIGGTFTDVVAWGPGGLWAVKVPSSRADPVRAVRAGIAAIASHAGFEPESIRRFVHGTTVATNAVLTRRGARVGLLATAGFEDVLEIGRQKRSRMYDLFQPPDTPVFLAPKRRRIGIAGRIGADGSEREPLDETAVRRAIHRLVEEEEIEALAVAYLFSFRNPAHERRTREIAGDVAPGLAVSLSSEIDPAFREYERTCVTAFDAYVRPVLAHYIQRLAGSLKEAGVGAAVEVMQSRGAVAAADRILARPVAALLSGPAAGALGGAVMGVRTGFPDTVTLDMGGTSTDIAVVRAGRVVVTREGRIDGYPLRVQMADVHTIGAGGGSIARIDEGGALKVGPESAEADPGPACYGQGGKAATVTDACLVLGLIDPASFAGGLALDPALARQSLQPLARAFAGDLRRAARGILTVAAEAIADAIRAVTIQRGIDPRGFALVALGGAGPLLGARVAAVLGMATVVVPARPGVLAAEGLLHAPVETERQASFARSAAATSANDLRAVLVTLAETGLPQPPNASVCYAADMRYTGQSYELEIPIAALEGDDLVARTVALFHRLYRETYGHGNQGEPVELVNLRAVVGYQPPAPPPDPPAAPGGQARPRAHRQVWFGDDAGEFQVPIWSRAALGPGMALAGPAIVEQPDTTTVVYPGQTLRVHETGALIISLPKGASG
ncbi:MAG: hydantoinase/oxoprolinase family protein [Alphaproteobacteria bacterium]|nr:hydantoinase/oxoprolinase family protein [Alphaproteobacteria bacterium]